MNKQFIVVDRNSDFHYIVDELNSLISDMYECELMNGETIEQCSEWFFSNHIVFEAEGYIRQVLS
jgi:hypothetical protein